MVKLKHIILALLLTSFGLPMLAANQQGASIIPNRKFGLKWNTKLGGDVALLRIWFTLDNGNTWRLYSETDNPTSPAPVKVVADGRYGFYTQTRDTAGLEEAPPVRGTPPATMVVVDTKRPALVLVNPNSADIYSNTQDIRIEWNASDINFSATPISLYTSIDGGGTWSVIKKGAPNSGSYLWKLPATSSQHCSIKIVATDLAGNESDDVSDNKFIVDGKEPISRVTGPREAKSPNFDVTYNVKDLGGAGVAKITLYYQLDEDKEWHVYGDDKDLTSPIAFRAKKGGRFGFKMVATDRVGNREKTPDADTRPDVWCLMDAIKPLVTLTSFKGSNIPPAGATKIRPISWRASDDNLAPSPIIIEVSHNDGGTWMTVVSSYKNSGTYPWVIPMGVDVDNARIKVSALDVLGNKGYDISDSFRIDGTPPESTITGIVLFPETGGDVPALQIEEVSPSTLTTPISDNDYVEKAIVSVNNNDLIDAESMLRKALEVNESNYSAYHYLGYVSFLREDIAKAVAYYSKSIEINPNFQDSHTGLGICYLQKAQAANMNSPEEAKAYYRKASLQYEASVAIVPDTWEEYYNLGYVYAKLKKYDRALTHLSKAVPLTKDPSDLGDTYWFLAQVYQIEGNKAKALEAYQKAEDSYPQGGELQQKAAAKKDQLQNAK